MSKKSSPRRGGILLEVLIAMATFAAVAVSVLASVGNIQEGAVRLAAHRAAFRAAANNAALLHIKSLNPFLSLQSGTVQEEAVSVARAVTDSDPFTKLVAVTGTPAAPGGIGQSVETIVTDWEAAEGGSGCDLILDGDWSAPAVRGVFRFASRQTITGFDAVGTNAYVAVDSPIQSDPDLFVVDITDPANPVERARLHTGPGLSGIHVAWPFAYVANASSVSQLQVVSIADPDNPRLHAAMKLSGVISSGGGGVGKSIWYSRGRIFLGLARARGPEFHIIDVSDPLRPLHRGSLEIDTTVNGLFSIANRAYLATPQTGQLRIADISDTGIPAIGDIFSPPDAATHNGKSLSFANGTLFFGRNVGIGGYGRPDTRQVFAFRSDASFGEPLFSLHTNASVNAMVARHPYLFLATNDAGGEFQVWDVSDTANPQRRAIGDLPGTAAALECEGQTVLVASNDTAGTGTLSLIRAEQ